MMVVWHGTENIMDIWMTETNQGFVIYYPVSNHAHPVSQPPIAVTEKGRLFNSLFKPPRDI